MIANSAESARGEVDTEGMSRMRAAVAIMRRDRMRIKSRPVRRGRGR